MESQFSNFQEKVYCWNLAEKIVFLFEEHRYPEWAVPSVAQDIFEKREARRILAHVVRTAEQKQRSVVHLVEYMVDCLDYEKREAIEVVMAM